MIKIIANCLIVMLTYLVGNLHFAYAAKDSCDKRRQEIEMHIQEAKNYGNYYQVLGLEKALRDINTYCNKTVTKKTKRTKVNRENRTQIKK